MTSRRRILFVGFISICLLFVDYSTAADTKQTPTVARKPTVYRQPVSASFGAQQPSTQTDSRKDSTQLETVRDLNQHESQQSPTQRKSQQPSVHENQQPSLQQASQQHAAQYGSTQHSVQHQQPSVQNGPQQSSVQHQQPSVQYGSTQHSVQYQQPSIQNGPQQSSVQHQQPSVQYGSTQHSVQYQQPPVQNGLQQSSGQYPQPPVQYGTQQASVQYQQPSVQYGPQQHAVQYGPQQPTQYYGEEQYGSQLPFYQDPGQQFTRFVQAGYPGDYNIDVRHGYPDEGPGYKDPEIILTDAEGGGDNRKKLIKTKYGYQGAFTNVSLRKPLRKQTINNSPRPPGYVARLAPYYAGEPNPIYVGAQYNSQFQPRDSSVQQPLEYFHEGLRPFDQFSGQSPPYGDYGDYGPDPYPLPPAPIADFNPATVNRFPGESIYPEPLQTANPQGLPGKASQPFKARFEEKKSTADGQIQSIKFVLTHESYKQDSRLNSTAAGRLSQAPPETLTKREENVLRKAIHNLNSKYASGYSTGQNAHTKDSQFYNPAHSVTQQPLRGGTRGNAYGPGAGSYGAGDEQGNTYYGVPYSVDQQNSYDNHPDGNPYSNFAFNDGVRYFDPSAYNRNPEAFPESARVYDKGPAGGATSDASDIVPGESYEIPAPGLAQPAYFLGGFPAEGNPFAAAARGQQPTYNYPISHGFSLSSDNPGAGSNAYGVHGVQQQQQPSPLDDYAAGNPYGTVGTDGPFYNTEHERYYSYINNPVPGGTDESSATEAGLRHNVARYVNPYLENTGFGYPALPATLHDAVYRNPFDEDARRQDDKRKRARQNAKRRNRNKNNRRSKTRAQPDRVPVPSFAPRNLYNIYQGHA
ncbi:PREDICTED: uncharacterized protein LOC106810387 [Priapulus caudatus]|uniref:Uncharacterized protein LOC106810387 n=1 Tax=Priapulus caudatus TaxID=37621 RepID=A0ABM1EAI8_PRICU|nr:PREDICTED: uncharacterized protein LOC106810387 [Priapulus caudatus]XP_014669209.1 PREDICTED: uncharacterized protein LOC106810387 [Priapulus caudatus]